VGRGLASWPVNLRTLTRQAGRILGWWAGALLGQQPENSHPASGEDLAHLTGRRLYATSWTAPRSRGRWRGSRIRMLGRLAGKLGQENRNPLRTCSCPNFPASFFSPTSFGNIDNSLSIFRPEGPRTVLERFASTVLEHGRDRYGDRATPLFVDGLHVDTLEPVRWRTTTRRGC
jgi:hypothetical protein